MTIKTEKILKTWATDFYSSPRSSLRPYSNFESGTGSIEEIKKTIESKRKYIKKRLRTLKIAHSRYEDIYDKIQYPVTTLKRLEPTLDSKDRLTLSIAIWRKKLERLLPQIKELEAIRNGQANFLLCEKKLDDLEDTVPELIEEDHLDTIDILLDNVEMRTFYCLEVPESLVEPDISK
jgi:hypothetical protein